MPVLVTMPSLSPTMEKGNLVKWCKQIGDSIEVGDVIAEIDTDKATMEVEALHKGILAKIIVAEGTRDVPVKAPIAVIKQKNDTDDDVENFQISSTPSAATDTINVMEVTSIPVAIEVVHPDKIKASPLARRIAAEYGIDISAITGGSGPNGRIVKADVLNYKPAPAPDRFASYIDKKAGSLTLAVANKLTYCKQTVPHFYMNIKVDVTDVMILLKKFKEKQADVKITIGSFVVRAIALAMKKYPGINVVWEGTDTLRYYQNFDVSVAVAVDGGIYTPVIRNADNKSVKQIAMETKELADRAKAGRLKPEEYTGGSITTSNLGMYDIESFYSIINFPQGSIISVARAVQAPLIRDGRIEVGHTLTLGYAVDHRAIDGKLAGQFLTELKHLLENPIDIII